MATVIHFEAIRVEEHIFVNGVVAGTVVIVNSSSCAIIRKDKVTADQSLRRFKAWNLWHVCEKSLSIPSVDRAMISRLPTGVPNQIP